MSVDNNKADHVAALVYERAAYVSQGKYDRVAAVDAELAKLRGQAAHPARHAQTRLQTAQTR